MPRAVILGGTGAIGRATASRLLAAGWSVDYTGREPSRAVPELDVAGARFVTFEVDDPGAMSARVGAGADLLVDCVCFTAVHAGRLVEVMPKVGNTVMISSKAVYVDADGNHSNSSERPRFDGPIPESQPTLAPGSMEYRSPLGYGSNKVAAENVLLDSGLPVSILRPSKIHGAGSANPREWMFVRRALDKRRVVLLAKDGRGVDHPTAAANVASLIETVAPLRQPRILNIADPDAPTALEIARTMAAHLGHSWREVLLDDSAPAGLGRTHWDAVPPRVLDLSAALALGYTPAGTYAETVGAEIDWLVREHDTLDLSDFDDAFDYAAEDEYLASEP
ncbi:MAG TPA: NAD(P)H-binding protein [Galbitalea sp.]|jgi:nucleoside-diphosphate-sugar epimerase|nr:NAD(P)H-binding protein [Galbitalea sp.]